MKVLNNKKMILVLAFVFVITIFTVFLLLKVKSSTNLSPTNSDAAEIIQEKQAIGTEWVKKTQIQKWRAGNSNNLSPTNNSTTGTNKEAQTIGTEWVKRKQIQITNTNNKDLTDFQVEVQVTFEKEMQPDFDDIRFTDEDTKTILPHWLESKTNSNSAIFWVKIPRILKNSTKKIYVYYGNQKANSTSNGEKVFIFFDDAEKGNINEKWEAVLGQPKFLYTKDLSYSGNWYEDRTTDYHGPMTTYTDRHRPMAVYAPSQKKTYFVFGSSDGYAEIGYYDHVTKKFSNPVEVGLLHKKSENSEIIDAHRNPSILINSDGYIFVFYGSHGTTMYTRRSLYPYDISSWIDRASIPAHTYPQSWELKKGEVIHFYRGPDYNGFYRISKDGISSWGNAVKFIDFGVPGARWAYVMTVAENTEFPRTIHATWTIREGPGRPRKNVYYARSEDGGVTWMKSNGTKYQLPINEQSAQKILNSGNDQVQSSDLQVDSFGNVYALYTQGYENGCTWKVLKLDRSTNKWHISEVGAACDHQFDIGSMVIRSPYDIRLYLPSVPTQPNNDGGDVEEWVSTNGGQSWRKRSNLTTNSQYSHNFIRTVYNSAPEFRAFWGYGDSLKGTKRKANTDGKTSELFFYGSNNPKAQKIKKGTTNSTIQVSGSEYNNHIIRAKGLNLTDFVLEADVKPSHRLNVLSARVREDGINYSVRANYEDARIHVFKGCPNNWLGGDLSVCYRQLGKTTIGRDIQKFHNWKVVMNGYKISFYWDDLLLLDVVDDEKTVSSGSIGARVTTDPLEMDNVRVRKFAEKEPTVQIL